MNDQNVTDYKIKYTGTPYTIIRPNKLIEKN